MVYSIKIKFMNPITQVVYPNYTLTSCDPFALYMYDHSVNRNPESLSVF